MIENEKINKRLKKKRTNPCKEVQLTFIRRLLISEFSVDQQNDVSFVFIKNNFRKFVIQ